MPEEKRPVARPQNLILENRKRLVLSGVKEVVSFDETALSLETDLGRLEVRGNGMHIDSFDTKSGDMTVSGDIYATVYREVSEPRGFIKRVFR